MKIALLVVDFGSQTTQLILRRVRELGVYCEIVTSKNLLIKVKQVQPKAIIFSGGPSSLTQLDSPKIDKTIFDLKIPILGICYGMQAMCESLGGKVIKAKRREFGRSGIRIKNKSKLFEHISLIGETKDVWMSHGDEVKLIPKGFKAIAVSKGTTFAAIANEKRSLYGLQFHPEVVHTKIGKKILYNFTRNIAGITSRWSMQNFLKREILRIKQNAENKKIICGLSGGVDSSVVAALIDRSVGKNLTCIFVNHGLLRKGEPEEVLKTFKANFKAKIIYINARRKFLKALKGISEPELKRKIIGKTFIDIFQSEASKIKDAKYLAQGTLYPDVIESMTNHGPSNTVIKTHHNVGGLPKNMKLKLIEPLRELFKDEVRRLGYELGLPKNIIERHPFPGPGLAIRIPGEINEKKISMLQNADFIFIEELKKNGLYEKTWQAFSVLLPVKSVGVMGDNRSYERVIALRAVTSTDGMTADVYKFKHKFLLKVANRIIEEVEGINRVVYDITSKPPSTIEWE